ncbi:MAG: trigger factor [Treponema sp.]|nr:trigger factor [Treponema sp.]
MSVTKEITRLEKSNVRLSLTIPREDVQSQYQGLLKDYCKNVQLPGFRKGHVPQEVLERKFGESLKGEALGKIIEQAVGEALGDEGLPRDERPLPYSQPELQGEPKLDFGEDLVFSVVYDVLPSVSIGQWKGLEVEVPSVAVSEDDIARELAEVRERNAFVLDRDESAEAQNGDVVTVTYCELDDNDEMLSNSQREDFAFTLGSGQNAYQFDDDIVGMKKGETRVFAKTYAADTEIKAFAGTTKRFRLSLSALKEKKLPDLDDDLAQDVDEKYHTLDDLKKSIRERLEGTLERRIRELKINKLLEKIMENTPVTLPESMVRVELDGRIRNLARQFGIDNEKVLEILAMSGGGLGDIETKWRPAAEKALHSRLIVDTLMEQEHIDAGDGDIEKELEDMAEESGESVEEIKQHYGEGTIKELIRDNVKERKLFDMLLAENTIKTGPAANYLDVMANNG